MDDFKTNDDKPSIDPSLHKSNKKINTELFDETLRQIEETLKNLGEKITPKRELQINHDVIKETNNSDEEHEPSGLGVSSRIKDKMYEIAELKDKIVYSLTKDLSQLDSNWELYLNMCVVVNSWVNGCTCNDISNN